MAVNHSKGKRHKTWSKPSLVDIDRDVEEIESAFNTLTDAADGPDS